MDLAESIDRLTADGNGVATRFYELFFERCPEARARFERTDMSVQSVMLTMALTAVRQHPSLSRASEGYLRVLGTKHNRIGVPLELYPKFLEALIATLQEFHGADWDAELERQWREAFEAATGLIREGYEQKFHI